MDKLEAPSVLGSFFTFYGRAENYACSAGYDPIYQKQASFTAPNSTPSAQSRHTVRAGYYYIGIR
jgi:hypothetical protein